MGETDLLWKRFEITFTTIIVTTTNHSKNSNVHVCLWVTSSITFPIFAKYSSIEYPKSSKSCLYAYSFPSSKILSASTCSQNSFDETRTCDYNIRVMLKLNETYISLGWNYRVRSRPGLFCHAVLKYFCNISRPPQYSQSWKNTSITYTFDRSMQGDLNT